MLLISIPYAIFQFISIADLSNLYGKISSASYDTESIHLYNWSLSKLHGKKTVSMCWDSWQKNQAIKCNDVESITCTMIKFAGKDTEKSKPYISMMLILIASSIIQFINSANWSDLYFKVKYLLHLMTPKKFNHTIQFPCKRSSHKLSFNVLRQADKARPTGQWFNHTS